ncbi:integrator complex subunit 14 [Hyalella azteca]|uniref:Integrator complex subunit 14 n=1 Tax=Hyalella azteca TaxID=294128 RepID=A0A8B7N1F8_HYAAZ|nr:integrator complex subunit 14 [Hyalella azteca]
MPTVILLDVSFSMCRPVPNIGGQDEAENSSPLLRKDLAALACCQLLDHLTLTNKLEFVSLVIYSSLYEVVVGFTRDYNSIRKAVMQVGDYDKTCLHGALQGTVLYCKEEWGNNMPCQILVITDGAAGVGQSGYLRSLTGPRAAQNFPLPLTVPATLDIVCLASPDDPALLASLPLYQRYVELNGDGSVHVPQGKLSKKSTRDLMSEVLSSQFSPYHGVLRCGNLSTNITLAPPPQPYQPYREVGVTNVRETMSKELLVLGFLSIVDVSSPPASSRHLLLPLQHKGEGNSTSSPDGAGSGDEEVSADEGKIPSLCVVLHGGLKKEGKVALCQVAPNWYGILYSWSDNKKKSNLLLSIFHPGTDVIPWLGKLDELGPASCLPENPYTDPDALPPFPVKSGEKRSYNQACVVWVRAGGLQSDVQKILRHARKLPDKTNSFYKELNRVRRAALQYGFPSLLHGLSAILEREVLSVPAQAEAAIQLQHACAALMACAHSAMDPNVTDNKHHSNIVPLKTNYASHD